MVKNKISFLFQICLLAVSSAAVFAADTVKLAENGKALATIEVAPQASVMTRSVADEMARYLERMSGAPFEVTKEPGDGPRIVLGRNNEFPALKYGDKLRGNGQEAFLMRTEGDKVLLLGVTDRAASHAAYTFLERLGVRWFFPTAEWEVVPTQSTLTANFDEVQSPDMPIQRSIWYGGLTGYYLANVIRQDWMRHNRMKTDGPSQSHSWIGLDKKKDFAEHPEWFSEVDGKRRASKPNYGHPEVIKKAVTHALDIAATGADSVSVSAPDGLNFCECDLCLQIAGVTRESLFKHNGAIFGTRPDGTVVCVTSETIFRMANEVAKVFGQKYPDVLVSIFAYSGYAHPPSFDLEPNVYVPVTSSYRRTPLSYEEQIKMFGEKTKQLGVYEYYHLTLWHGFKPGSGPKRDDLSEQMRFYHANGVMGVNAESTNNWGPAGLDFYIASKLMWDAETDVDAVYADFLGKAFGAAKAPMKSYYDRWEAKADPTPGTINAATEDLIAAYKLAETTAVKKRIAQLYLYMRLYRLDMERKNTREDPERAAQAGGEYADLFWRAKNTYLLHEKVTRTVNRAMVPGFTAAEIEAMMAEDTAWLKKNEALLLTYSRSLVPITTAGRTVPGVQQQPISTGKARRVQFIMPAKAGETVNIGFKPSEEKSDYRVLLMTSEDFRLGAGRKRLKDITAGEATDAVSFQAAQDGYYEIMIDDIDAVTSVSHPHALDGNEQAIENAKLYFYVPRGTKEFKVIAAAEGGPTLSVQDATGKTVFTKEGFATTQKKEGERFETTITVPTGADGSVWSLTGPGDVDLKSKAILVGVPNYYSLNPQQLLVAEEYLR